MASTPTVATRSSRYGLKRSMARPPRISPADFAREDRAPGAGTSEAGQIEDREGERDRRHRIPEEGDGSPCEEQPELPLGERPETAYPVARFLSQYRFIPR
jgi:hypothetical protein